MSAAFLVNQRQQALWKKSMQAMYDTWRADTIRKIAALDYSFLQPPYAAGYFSSRTVADWENELYWMVNASNHPQSVKDQLTRRVRIVVEGAQAADVAAHKDDVSQMKQFAAVVAVGAVAAFAMAPATAAGLPAAGATPAAAAAAGTGTAAAATGAAATGTAAAGAGTAAAGAATSGISIAGIGTGISTGSATVDGLITAQAAKALSKPKQPQTQPQTAASVPANAEPAPKIKPQAAAAGGLGLLALLFIL